MATIHLPFAQLRKREFDRSIESMSGSPQIIEVLTVSDKERLSRAFVMARQKRETLQKTVLGKKVAVMKPTTPSII